MRNGIYSALFRNVFFPAWEGRLRGRPTLEHLAWLEKTQYRPLDELQALQDAALRKLIRHAYHHVPFYRARMDAARVRPEDISTARDLSRLPLLSRAEVRGADEARASTVAPLPNVKKATSGSSGEPFAFAYDAGSEHWRQALKLRGYGWAGYRPGDPSLHYWGAQATANPSMLQRNKIALDRFLRREVYVNCSRRGDDDLMAAVEQIRRARPSAIFCFTQAGADLARFVNDRGLRDWDDIAVVCGAERLFAADREALAGAFGPSVFETYGCREVMLMGAECERHDGLHLSYENVLLEVVVPDENRLARPGEVGEVAVTDLHNFGMPFIRYLLGDLAEAPRSEPCACGRTLPRLGAVEGRVTETLLDDSGARVSGLVFSVLTAGPLARAVKQFQAVQHKDRSITFKIVPHRALVESDHEAIRATCAAYLKGIIVKTEVVSEIPLGKSGKRKLVIVER